VGRVTWVGYPSPSPLFAQNIEKKRRCSQNIDVTEFGGKFLITGGLNHEPEVATPGRLFGLTL
jgi:hypothetical protein